MIFQTKFGSHIFFVICEKKIMWAIYLGYIKAVGAGIFKLYNYLKKLRLKYVKGLFGHEK
jgi:hypothetical protein